jgi:hypothetical protein
MIPKYTQVAAIDDVKEELQQIVWGLGIAGFSPLAFHFDDGRLEGAPTEPLVGVRVVFTDIHLVSGGISNEKIHTANIIKCLKSIVATGPYVLVFWTKYPEDATRYEQLIAERAEESGLKLPIAVKSINKKEVLDIAAGHSDALNAEKLRQLIVDRLSGFDALAIAMEWEARVGRAAALATNRIHRVVSRSAEPSVEWASLFAFLAVEGVGYDTARADPTGALDDALLPVLEDQLLVSRRNSATGGMTNKTLGQLLDKSKPARPPSATVSLLNTSYLVEECKPGSALPSWSRGMATELASGFINSGPFIRAFGRERETLVHEEFATRALDSDEICQIKLFTVEIGAECDHVNGKVSTHRYLLAALVPIELFPAFAGQMTRAGKPPKSPKYKNDSIRDLGRLHLEAMTTGGGSNEWHLLISCRSFMALAAAIPIDGTPRLRLRKDVIEEVAHHYATYCRRPGVMRFCE